MADTPILLNLAGAAFTFSQENGGYLQAWTRKTSAQVKLKVFDVSQGATVGRVIADFMADYTIRLITTTNIGGLVGSAPGVIVTLANTTTGNGVTTGGVYAEDTDLTHNAEQLQEFSLTAQQWPLIS